MADLAANGGGAVDRGIEVAAIARHAATAFPPTEAVERDGWLLRATPGLDRGRLNSALALVPHPPLATVTDFYAARGAVPQVQLLSNQPQLAAELDALRWGARWPTAVLVRESTGPSVLIPADGAGIGTLGPRSPRDGEVEILDAADPRWLAAWARAEGRDAADAERHRAHAFSRLPAPVAFALAPDDSAAGIAVAHGAGGLAGVFSVAVDPARRRAGRGTDLMLRLLAWARAQGAGRAYLEVERRNAAALALYARLGFTEAYGYVHRAGPPAGPPGQDRPAAGDGSH